MYRPICSSSFEILTSLISFVSPVTSNVFISIGSLAKLMLLTVMLCGFNFRSFLGGVFQKLYLSDTFSIFYFIIGENVCKIYLDVSNHSIYFILYIRTNLSLKNIFNIFAIII